MIEQLQIRDRQVKARIEKMKRLKELKEKKQLLEEGVKEGVSTLGELIKGSWIRKEAEEARFYDEDKRCEAKEEHVSMKKPTIPNLTEDTFEEWKVEVESIIKSGLYHGQVIRQAIRKSLTRKTRNMF